MSLKNCMLEFYDDATQVLKTLKKELKILNQDYVVSFQKEKVSEKDTNEFREQTNTLIKSLNNAMRLSDKLSKRFLITEIIHNRNDFFVVNIK